MAPGLRWFASHFKLVWHTGQMGGGSWERGTGRSEEGGGTPYFEEHKKPLTTLRGLQAFQDRAIHGLTVTV